MKWITIAYPDPEDVGAQVRVVGASKIWRDEGKQPVEQPAQSHVSGLRHAKGMTLVVAYQLDAVVIDKHFARTLSGKISPVTTPTIISASEVTEGQ